MPDGDFRSIFRGNLLVFNPDIDSCRSSSRASPRHAIVKCIRRNAFTHRGNTIHRSGTGLILEVVCIKPVRPWTTTVHLPHTITQRRKLPGLAYDLKILSIAGKTSSMRLILSGSSMWQEDIPDLSSLNIGNTDQKKQKPYQCESSGSGIICIYSWFEDKPCSIRSVKLAVGNRPEFK